MKQLLHYTMLLTFLCSSYDTSAQQYKWLKGGGSTDIIQNGGTQDEPLKQICVDDNGNVYGLAQIGNNNIAADTFSLTKTMYYASVILWHVLFVSYDCNGNMRFARVLESSGKDEALALAYNAGKVYVGCMMNGQNKKIANVSFTGTNPSVITRFDTLGQYEWSKFLPGPGSLMAFDFDAQNNFHCFATMENNVQITPTILSQKGNYDIKFDNSGNVLTAARLQVADTGYVVKKAIIDANNNSYVSFARFPVDVQRSQGCLGKFGTSANNLWLDTLSIRSGILSFKLANAGIYVCGPGTGGYPYVFAGKSATNTSYGTGSFTVVTTLDFNGIGKSIYHVDGKSVVGLADLEILPDYSLAFCGVFAGRIRYGNDSLESTVGEGWNPFVLNMDTSGKLLSWHEIHGAGFEDIAYTTALDKMGSLFISGQMESSLSVSGLPTLTSHGGNSDFYLAKYGYDCDCTPADKPVSSYTHLVAADPKVIHFTYTGSTADSVVWDFGDGTKTKQNNVAHTYATGGNYIVCATAYKRCGKHTSCKQLQVTVGIEDIIQSTVSIYPNPFTGLLTIEGAAAATKISLMNMLGQQVYNGVLSSNKETINTSNMPAGNYILHLTDAAGQRKSIKLTKD
jgi:hypothetical protein